MFFTCCSLYAAEAITENGNIIFVNDSGNRIILTTSGRDRNPCLSPKKTSVVFSRYNCLESKKSSYKIQFSSDIYLVDIKTRKEKILIHEGQKSDIGKSKDNTPKNLAGLGYPRFSSDGTKIFFLSKAWETSGAIHVLNLKTGAIRFVTDGRSLEVLHSKRFKDYLIVNKHKYFLGGGSYDWYWLVNSDGEEIDAFGDNEDAIILWKEVNAQKDLRNSEE